MARGKLDDEDDLRCENATFPTPDAALPLNDRCSSARAFEESELAQVGRATGQRRVLERNV
jgi:hypothetical protein